MRRIQLLRAILWILLAIVAGCSGWGDSDSSGPAITAQPESRTVRLGDPVSLTVATAESGNTFQWFKDGAPVAGATSSTLTIPAAQRTDAGSYRARVTNAQGSTDSAAATLTVQYLAITAQPQSVGVAPGTTATFTVGAEGVPDPSFQWFKNGVAVAGATAASFSFNAAVADDNAAISVVVSNAFGSLTSSVATLSVNAALAFGDPGGVTVQKLITAAAGGSLTMQDGAVLTIPAGALPADTLISVTVPKGQQLGGRNLTYLLEPQGLVFSKPATLTIPYTKAPGTVPKFSVYSSSTSNPLSNAGSEMTNWTQLMATGADDAAQTFTVPIDHFSIIFVSVDDYAYLVMDIPPKFLKPADLLFTLTNTDDKPGPDWKPGHVGLYTGTCDDVNQIIESTSPPGVRVSTLNTFKTDNGHIYLGPRRVAVGASGAVTDAERTGIVNYVRDKVGRPYSLIGDGAIAQGREYSCVGLVEAAYQSVGKPALTGFQKVFATVPLEMYRTTVPVDDISMCPGEAVAVPVYAVKLDPASPSVFTTIRGWYKLADVPSPESIAATLLPPGATFDPSSPVLHRYTFNWTPATAHAGQTFQAAFDTTLPIATTGPLGGRDNLPSVRLQQSLTLHVKTLAECALGSTITSSISDGHTVGGTPCPQSLGSFSVSNRSACKPVTFTAASSDSAIEVSPAGGSIPVGGAASLGVSFNCSKFPPLSATITVTVTDGNTSSLITVPVTLNRN